MIGVFDDIKHNLSVLCKNVKVKIILLPNKLHYALDRNFDDFLVALVRKIAISHKLT